MILRTYNTHFQEESMQELRLFQAQKILLNSQTKIALTQHYWQKLNKVLWKIFNIYTLSKDTLKRCLQKDPYNRPGAVELLQHPYLKPPNFPNNDGGNMYCELYDKFDANRNFRDD